MFVLLKTRLENTGRYMNNAIFKCIMSRNDLFGKGVTKLLINNWKHRLLTFSNTFDIYHESKTEMNCVGVIVKNNSCPKG